MSDFKLFLRACGLLRELVDEPVVTDTIVGPRCHYCGADYDLVDTTNHEKNCVWVEAVAFLAEYDEGLM